MKSTEYDIASVTVGNDELVQRVQPIDIPRERERSHLLHGLSLHRTKVAALFCGECRGVRHLSEPEKDCLPQTKKGVASKVGVAASARAPAV